MPAAVELVGDRKARVRTSLQTEGCGSQRPRLSNPNQDAEEVLSEFLKAMVKRRIWVNIAVCLCLHSSLTHHRNIENKAGEIHVFIKSGFVRSLKFVIIFDYVSAYAFIFVYGYTTQVGV